MSDAKTELEQAARAAKAENDSAPKGKRGGARPGAGRPKGSGAKAGSSTSSARAQQTFKMKAPELSPQILRAAACMPMLGMGALLTKVAKLPPGSIVPAEDIQVLATDAFDALLKSLEVELTPGKAYLVATAAGMVQMMALTGVIIVSQRSAAKQAAAQQAQQAAPAPDAPVTPQPVTTTPENPANAPTAETGGAAPADAH